MGTDAELKTVGHDYFWWYSMKTEEENEVEVCHQVRSMSQILTVDPGTWGGEEMNWKVFVSPSAT